MSRIKWRSGLDAGLMEDERDDCVVNPRLEELSSSLSLDIVALRNETTGEKARLQSAWKCRVAGRDDEDGGN